MMARGLKDLYREVIEGLSEEEMVRFERWRERYSTFHAEVEDIREQLKGGESLFGKEDFLKKLLFEQKNGIANKGKSNLKNVKPESLIKNEDFLSSLAQFIIDPDKDNFEKFGKAWSHHSKGNNPVLVNRVAAACTLEVSTTVENERFKQVFKWLIQEGMIPEYQGEDNWFSKNVFLMEHIHDAFCDEIQRGETDEFYLSQFVWKLYQKVFQKP